MSALPPIATAKANSCKRSCPLYPRKRTCAAQSVMSALGQKRTLLLFDHLIGTGEHSRRDGDAYRFCGLEVDYQLEFRWLLDRQIAGVGTFKDLVDVFGCMSVFIGQAWRIAH